ncbi:MAG: hypothetical protein AAFO70_02710 [Pseudomonadota bacterium]
MTRFLTLTLAFIVMTIAMWPAHSQMLNAEQFQAELVGKKLETKRMGLRARLVFSPDGRVALNAPVGAAEGTWTMAGKRLCVKMKSGPRQGERCGTLTKLADGRYMNSQGRVFTAR